MSSLNCLLFLLVSSACLISCLQYTNPLIPLNLPDPGIFYHAASDSYYVVTTRTSADLISIHHSRDLVQWQKIGAVFHAPVPWISTTQPSYWAPEIHKVGTKFVVVYAGRGKDGVMCVGIGVASNVSGPYHDIGHPAVKPILQNGQKVGAIDPTIWTDPVSKKTYLVWK